MVEFLDKKQDSYWMKCFKTLMFLDRNIELVVYVYSKNMCGWQQLQMKMELS